MPQWRDGGRLLSRPTSKAGRLQRACLDVLGQYRSQQLIPVPGRFVFYDLEQAGIIPKQYTERGPDRKPRKKPRQPGQDVADALTVLRKQGIVPWGWISDEKRDLDEWEYAGSVANFVKAQVSFARIALWDGQPPPLVICESAAVAGVLRRHASDYLTPITATSGQCGGHLHVEVAPRLLDANGNPLGRRVLYIGDYELRGPAEQIEANTLRVLSTYDPGLPQRWERLALTAEQVQARGWQSKAIIKVDGRYRRTGGKTYEAIEAEILRGEIVELFRARLDRDLPEPLERVQIRERQQREQVAAMLRQWRPS
jgi:hypothetical protein